MLKYAGRLTPTNDDKRLSKKPITHLKIFYLTKKRPGNTERERVEKVN